MSDVGSCLWMVVPPAGEKWCEVIMADLVDGVDCGFWTGLDWEIEMVDGVDCGFWTGLGDRDGGWVGVQCGIVGVLLGRVCCMCPDGNSVVIF